MSELSFRTLLIAVGIFITLATISALMIYYNVSVSTATAASDRTNIEFEYNRSVERILSQDILTGVDFKNIVRNYFMDSTVKINILKIKGINTTDMPNPERYENINNNWAIESTVDSEKVKILSESRMEIINPSYKIKRENIEIKKEGDIQVINILNIEE